jgi:response regulator RpfG family c-di-GMP phosphodiesterase
MGDADEYEEIISDKDSIAEMKTEIPNDAAVKQLQKCAGVELDPELVSLFIEKVLR